MLKAQAREPELGGLAMALQSPFGALGPDMYKNFPFGPIWPILAPDLAKKPTMAVPLRRISVEASGGRAGYVCLISLPFRGLV